MREKKRLPSSFHFLSFILFVVGEKTPIEREESFVKRDAPFVVRLRHFVKTLPGKYFVRAIESFSGINRSFCCWLSLQLRRETTLTGFFFFCFVLFYSRIKIYLSRKTTINIPKIIITAIATYTYINVAFK